jgi:uncharacterized protein
MKNLTIQPSTRIESIDILRAFTLFGIIIVHMVEQYYAGQWPKEYETAIYGSIADQVVGAFTGILISGKFFMIFSFLFGMSFYIQLSKSEGDKSFVIRFLWRLILLFTIGFVHHLHYRGDILTIYAVLGIGLLLFYKLPDKYLLALSLFLVFNIPSHVTRAIQIFYPGANPFDQNQEVLLAYFNTLKAGSYFEILRANFYEFAFKMEFQVFSGRIYITLGLFLLGVYAGRKKFFEDVSEKIQTLKRLRFYSWMTIIGAVVLALSFFGGLMLAEVKAPDAVNYLIGGFAADVFNTALATIYVIWILLLLQKEKWQKRLNHLYPVGKMGLTVYLMQTLFGTLIFFSYGLGSLGSLTAWMTFLIAIGLFVVQIFIAKAWFRYFEYGPIEWLWRNATYLRVYPLVKKEEVVEKALV